MTNYDDTKRINIASSTTQPIIDFMKYVETHSPQQGGRTFNPSGLTYDQLAQQFRSIIPTGLTFTAADFIKIVGHYRFYKIIPMTWASLLANSTKLVKALSDFTSSPAQIAKRRPSRAKFDRLLRPGELAIDYRFEQGYHPQDILLQLLIRDYPESRHVAPSPDHYSIAVPRLTNEAKTQLYQEWLPYVAQQRSVIVPKEIIDAINQQIRQLSRSGPIAPPPTERSTKTDWVGDATHKAQMRAMLDEEHKRRIGN